MKLQYGFDQSDNRYPLGTVDDLLKDPGVFSGKMAAIFKDSDQAMRITVEYSDDSVVIFEQVPPHTFEPHNGDWFMPRCKICQGFEDDDLHKG